MGIFASFTWVDALTVIGLYVLTYTMTLTVYRLWISPVAAFPGPSLARIPFLYEFYYNWIRLGTYYLKIKDMHERYGTTYLTIHFISCMLIS